MSGTRALFAELKTGPLAGGSAAGRVNRYGLIKFGNVSEMAGMNVIIISAEKIAR